jgi:hypothetical protein
MLLHFCSFCISLACSRHSSMSSSSSLSSFITMLNTLRSLSFLASPFVDRAADDVVDRAMPLHSSGLCLRQQPAHFPPDSGEHQYHGAPRWWAILSIGLGLRFCSGHSGSGTPVPVFTSFDLPLNGLPLNGLPFCLYARACLVSRSSSSYGSPPTWYSSSTNITLASVSSVRLARRHLLIISVSCTVRS